ncbi:MAG: FMN-binding protein [Acidobacteriota bacterium]
MNVTARMIFVLTTVGLISGALLATVGMLTQERIDLNKQREIEAAILQVVPGTQSSQTVFEQDGITVYAGSDGQGNLLGYAVLASGTGFQDIITLMFGTNPDLSVISKLTILDQKETPGLGANITSRDMFLKYWDNKDSVNPLTLHKPAVRTAGELGPGEINTITGATISSEKVLQIVNESLNVVKNLNNEGKLEKEDKHGR